MPIDDRPRSKSPVTVRDREERRRRSRSRDRKKVVDGKDGCELYSYVLMYCCSFYRY